MQNSQGAPTPAVFNVLLALADGDKHGYAILKDVAEHTGGQVQLSTGTLYGIIKRLLDDARRRYYRLTPEGRAVAAEEARRMERLLARARSTRLIQTHA